MSRRAVIGGVVVFALVAGALVLHERFGPASAGRAAEALGGEQVVALGAPVPAFELVDSTGAPFRSDASGRVAVLTFWCTTCHSCRDIERELAARAARLADDGVLVAAVDSNVGESPERVNDFLARREIEFPVLLDPRGVAAHLFGAVVTTTTVVLDADGRLAYRGAFAGADAAVSDLIAGRPVAKPESRAVG